LKQKERDAYRAVILTLHGVDYFYVDPADQIYPGEAPWPIDLCETNPKSLTEGGSKSFAGRFYTAATNAFIHFAATSAELRDV